MTLRSASRLSNGLRLANQMVGGSPGDDMAVYGIRPTFRMSRMRAWTRYNRYDYSTKHGISVISSSTGTPLSYCLTAGTESRCETVFKGLDLFYPHRAPARSAQGMEAEGCTYSFTSIVPQSGSSLPRW
jgi:hypothetical protein